ncbi:hypothetical protein [Alicyclobacillus sp. SO9]|uniref:hypothetical protein n=1 Tax=Alicyclobacillus sp. SO9 TaxID=2665646 RepID=UPI0018E83C5C|nr:hypothetical protein [Alicyclobacillus sp. SO9]QQE77369.1 hypothetical protein GI364_15575 [Alicyclobacillus sp. SO9]
MRISAFLVIASGLDLVAFLAVWVWRALSQPVALITDTLYFVLGAVGFILSVYGFVVLAKGGESTMRRAGLLVLFAFIPAVALLIAVLKVVGGHPV